MSEKLLRVGTSYIPVRHVASAADWYTVNLGAEINYQDEDKAILNLANQSFFLVHAGSNQSSNFFDKNGEEHFSVTFEVDGLSALEELQKEFKEKQMKVGDIEDRGHAGRNFVFWDMDGNMFDVWSELSPEFKSKYNI
ncbi:VOC family protein [Bacillus salacetis]|uniref:VOC family protein n=1 Tax=Bacillus salacetis TaxID=2315464 RepID=A0A3A1QRF0_9BACI|nr:VOC family protein [Bacillus salacetis]RIW28843.1 VOC family protein [Bacillus salacetis]